MMDTVAPTLCTVVGFGLVDLETEDGCLTDSRLCPEGLLISPHSFGWEPESDVSLTDVIFHDGSAICVVPPEASDALIRHESLLDSHSHQASFLPEPPNGFKHCMDRRSGRRVSSSVYRIFRDQYSRYADGRGCAKYQAEITLVDLAELLGFHTIEEAWRDIVPEVPESVRDVCRRARLFRDERTVLSLRPMVLSFWR